MEVRKSKSLRERYEEFYNTDFETAVKNNPYDEDEIPWSTAFYSSAESLAALRESEQLLNDPNAKAFNGVEKLFEYLESDEI